MTLEIYELDNIISAEHNIKFDKFNNYITRNVFSCNMQHRFIKDIIINNGDLKILILLQNPSIDDPKHNKLKNIIERILNYKCIIIYN